MSAAFDLAADSGRVLLVEDDAALADMLGAELEDRGYEVDRASGAAAALEQLAHGAPALVLTDLRLPDGDGFDVLKGALEHRCRPAVILITAFGSVPQAVEALKAGADDFLTKPLDLEHLALRVERALAQRRTNATLSSLRERLRDRDGLFHGMVGEGEAMQRLFGAIRRVARVDEPVLITGESGTGKERVARAIHAESARSERPFVAVNCASVPEALLEAEFFGHTANAFTGAGAARPGLIVEADGGTLLLDEVGEMSPALQAKLLRALQERSVRPVGAAAEKPVDVRIIAATNRDLEADVREGRWREDLYYRLETLSVEVPPLRERSPDDRVALTAYFLSSLAAERDLPRLRLADEALDALQRYAFPGNVRELRNALTRAATFCENGLIELRHLPERVRPSLKRPAGVGDPLGLNEDPPPTLAEVEERYIRWIVERTGYNKQQAAKILNVGRRTIYRKLG
ncbi:MAG: sigma-54-dependent Fis family transcriptional regulator [Gammaproteobacteria bacterium]|nr:sigma-54-dependent Fis family transcriptional regulator [Gammaproteobacteria bacterium]